MKSVIIAVLTVAATFAQQRITTTEKCGKITQSSKDEVTRWLYDSGTFLDCLTDEIDKDLRNIRFYRQKKLDELITIFSDNQYQCTSYFSKQGSRDRSSNIRDYFTRGDLVLILQDERNNFFASDPESQQLIADGVALLRELIWGIAGNQEFTKCILSDLRDKFFDFIEDCIGNRIGQRNFAFGRPRPSFLPTTSEVDELKQFVETYAKAYILLRHCGSNSQQDNIIRKITAEARDETCACARNNFEFCQHEYNEVCPNVKPCIDRLIADPKKFLEGSKNADKPWREERQGLARHLIGCVSKVRRSGGSTEGIPNLRELKDDGEELIKVFEGLNADSKKSLGDFAKRVAEAHFQADFCYNCRL